MEYKSKTESDAKIEDIKNEPITEIDERVVKQLEYYFGDANLLNDKYLSKQIENDPWVDIKVLLNFNRLRAISNDPIVIGSAIKKFPDSIVEVDELNTKIRRKVDVAIDYVKNNVDEMIERSIYCKGFHKETTMDEILQFSATYPDIVKVVERKLNNRQFKGSLYFVFNSKEQAEKFLNLESVKYKNIEIKRMWQKDFLKEKNLEYQKFKAQEIEKKKIKEERLLKRRGYLIKANNVKAYVTIDNIKAICAELNWQVDIVKINRTEKVAWILLKPIKIAKDLLKNMAKRRNRLNINFSIPEKEIEEIVLKNM